MASAAAPVPAAGRKWVNYTAGIFLLLVGSGLVYRQLSGNTMSQQRAEKQREKEAQELAKKMPGNAEAYSARLDARYKDLQDQANKEAEAKALVDARRAAPASLTTPVPKTVSGVALDTTLRTPDQPTEEQLAAYEALKAQRTADANRRMGLWEGGDRPQLLRTSYAAGSEDDRTPLMEEGTDERPLLTGTGVSGQAKLNAARARLADANSGLNPNAIVEALQGRSAPPRNSQTQQDASFLQNTADRQILPPLVARGGLGRYAIMEGTSIDVVMRTDVSSDIGGPCRAQVSRDVYDTVTGMTKLIPAGASLICTYNAEVNQGQERLPMAFTRLIYPTGASVQLGAMQGADSIGAIGAPAEVNSRFFRVFGSSFLIAMVTRAVQQQQSSNVTVNLSGATGGAAASALSDASRTALNRNINIKPELGVNAGEHLTVVVSRDMVLDPSVTGMSR